MHTPLCPRSPSIPMPQRWPRWGWLLAAVLLLAVSTVETVRAAWGGRSPYDEDTAPLAMAAWSFYWSHTLGS